MRTRLNIGDNVYVRFYNKSEKKFYGDGWICQIVGIDHKKNKAITVNKGNTTIDVHRKEIRYIIKE